MAILSDILYKVPLLSAIGNTAITISGIAFDSRKVALDSLFIATHGTNVDGHEYISIAIASGAIAIVCEKLPVKLDSNVTYIQVKDSAYALGVIASNYYGNPSEKLSLMGVTGTNGKTSTVTILYRLFTAMGYTCGMLSTVENIIADETIPSTHTTPDPLQLNFLMSKMVAKGCKYCFMEVSSHAIVQHRIAGLKFRGAMFTNISHDHLDYHKTFDEYIKAKKLFFDNLSPSAFALVNSDDKRGMVMLQNTKAEKHSFALHHVAEFKGKVISNSFTGLEMDINGRHVWFRLVGNFNAYNLLGIYGAATLLGAPEEEVLIQLSKLTSARGRFEQLSSPKGIIAVVDYAHTPDAIENVLNTIQELKKGNEKIITIIGCGGDRDKTKRPIMAKTAVDKSDLTILTSDNPRSENPEDIIREMWEGVPISLQRKAMKITDRREAIRTAIMMANPGDIILLAGKGHETYQEIKGTKHHFDDKEEIQILFDVLGK